MNWILNKIKPAIKKIFKKREKIDPSESLWKNCPSCGNLNYKESLKKNDWICNKCSYYFDKPPKAIIKTFFSDTATIIDPPKNTNDDPYNFKTELGSYKKKLEKARKKENQHTSIICAHGKIENLSVYLVVSNFKFIGGSWSANEAEYFTKCVDDAIENKCDVFVLVLKTGGVSMYHSTLGLQKVMIGGTMAMQKLKENNILTISVGQSKTTGGVLASIFYLSDIIVLEKGAHDLTFAGKKISKNYLVPGEEMKHDFGSAEEKLRTGFADLVVERDELKSIIFTLAKIIKKKEIAPETKDILLDDNTDPLGEVLSKSSKAL